mgnify:CR=1 FL=1
MKNKFVRNIPTLPILTLALSGIVFAQTSPTLMEAQKAYVAGNWKVAAENYEQGCPNLADTAQAECFLWNVLALSQTGVAADFSKAGKRLDSLISQTNPQKAVYADLLMTKAQFQLYLGRHERAAEALVHAIETAQPQHIPVLQKVCSAVQARVKSSNLEENCKKLSDPEAFVQNQPPVPVQPAPIEPPTEEAPKNIETKVPEKSDSTTTKAVSTPEKTNSKAVWYLQLGAFSVKANADLLVDNLKKRGIASKIEERAGENKTLYVVQSDDFATKEAANDFGEQKLKPLNVEFRAFLRK